MFDNRITRVGATGLERISSSAAHRLWSQSLIQYEFVYLSYQDMNDGLVEMGDRML